MKKDIKFITRADDAGSSHAANFAIKNVVTKGGFIKNVSVMACCKYVDEAAELLKDVKGIEFGLHGTLNSEWDKVKWGPVSSLPGDCGLLDENGCFLANPREFLRTKPDISLILKEYGAQLDRAARAGFNITYFDSHMMPEMAIDGLSEAAGEWCVQKGLIDHAYYYELPPGLLDPKISILKKLRDLKPGQYFFLTHPALYGEEMLAAGNSAESGERVAKGRSGEAAMFSRKITTRIMSFYGITPIRYDQAIPGKRKSPEDLRRILGVKL
ncbi:MAG: ChbG/HpnK family deacetylase [Oscillospiraceae bacterium]|jgi:hypothetical protein|nr:ChbG/HpnK family deacetylase [Oscillospiraceae bacterium]